MRQLYEPPLATGRSPPPNRLSLPTPPPETVDLHLDPPRWEKCWLSTSPALSGSNIHRVFIKNRQLFGSSFDVCACSPGTPPPPSAPPSPAAEGTQLAPRCDLRAT